MDDEKFAGLKGLVFTFALSIGIMIISAGPIWLIGWVIALLTDSEMPF